MLIEQEALDILQSYKVPLTDPIFRMYSKVIITEDTQLLTKK